MSHGNESSRLLVPIHIDALAVGTPKTPSSFQWTNLAPDFSKLKTTPSYLFGAQLVSNNGDPFKEAGGLKNERGIHLHFRLPAALRHGDQSGAGEVVFPAIPNRWLVQRFAGDATLTYKAWLVESDLKTDKSPGVTWPTFDKNKAIVLNKIGVATELQGSLADPDKPAETKLTAVGPGDPSFSAYYPACRSVLGFYDSVSEFPKGARLSYLVTGWYSDPKDDPLHESEWLTGKISRETLQSFRAQEDIPDGIALSDEQQKRLLSRARNAWFKARNWELMAKCSAEALKKFRAKEGIPDGVELSTDQRVKLHAEVRDDWFNALAAADQLPSRILCHGVVRGIAWKGPDESYIKMEDWDPSYKLAVGNTAGEAMAALLAPGEVDQDLLTALQADALTHPVTAADLLYELHERRFAGVQGDTIYVIRPEHNESDQLGAQGGAGQSNANGANPIPVKLRKLLTDLNTKQETFDRLSRRVEDWRWEVYAQWYWWVLALRKGDSNEAGKRQGCIELAKQALVTGHEASDSARSDRDKCEESVKRELNKYPKMQSEGRSRLNGGGKAELKYRLTKTIARPFQRPNDPVVAVWGAGAEPKNTYPTAGGLKCRIAGEEVTRIVLEIPGGGSSNPLAAEELASEMLAGWKALPVRDSIHRALIGEALLLDEGNAEFIAAKVLKVFSWNALSRGEQERLTKIVRSLQDPTSTQAQQNPAHPPNALTGSLPDPIATFNWRGNPWIPIFLAWEVLWQSDYQPLAALPEELVTEQWRLDRSGDLVPARLPADSIPSYEKAYQGYSLLSPRAANDMAKRLEALKEFHPLVDVLKNQQLQMQVLDGFHDALVLQQPGVQLPPMDYAEWRKSQGKVYKVDPIHEVINDGFNEKRSRFRTAPRDADGPFLPIRSGRLKVQRLSIIDAFGQTLKLPVDDVHNSLKKKWPESRLRRAHSLVVSSTQNDISLRPRFTQPMRLRFEWANGPDAENNSGPVCGWVLPNHLEKSLMIYSAAGKPMGALQKKLNTGSGSSAPAFYWIDVPGVDIPLGTDGMELIEDTDLRNFCQWISGLSLKDGNYFSGCLDTAMASADERVPEEDPGIAVLIGRPLALVRASLRFETAGLPAHRRGLGSGKDGKEDPEDILDTSGFEKVKWPVRLGDLNARNDGLIGVFQCPPVPPGRVIDARALFYPVWGEDESASKPFAVQDFKIDCDQPLRLTMLIDPQARVHATTGALPRAFLELTPEDVIGSKRVRDVFFQTAPLLAASDTPQMPRPSDDYGEWSWAFRPQVTRWKLDPKIVEATDRASFSGARPTITEGWLKLETALVKVLSFWVKEGDEAVKPGTRHLAWSLQGAESLKLEQIRDGRAIVVAMWDEPPFPREYSVTVDAAASYRITAFAETNLSDGAKSTKELSIEIIQ